MANVEKIELQHAFELLRKSYKRYVVEHPNTSVNDFLDSAILKRIGAFQYDRERANEVTANTMRWLDECGFAIEDSDFQDGPVVTAAALLLNVPREVQADIARQQRQNFVSMNASVHIGKEEYVELTGKLYALLFLIDDWLSNDTVKFLSETKKNILDHLKKELFRALLFGETGLAPLAPLPADGNEEDALFAKKTHRLFSACVTVFNEIKNATDTEYAGELLTKLGKHLTQGTIDHDTSVFNQPEIEAYRQIREDVSGMHVAIELIKMVTESYRQLRKLKKDRRTATHLQQLEKLLARFGGEGNDLLSLSKELRDKTIFNLLAVAFLAHFNAQREKTNPSNDIEDTAYLAFANSLIEVNHILHKLLNDFADELNAAEQAVAAMTVDDLNIDTTSELTQENQLEDVKHAIGRYIGGLRQYFLATKEWQMGDGAGRYADLWHLLRELRESFGPVEVAAVN